MSMSHDEMIEVIRAHKEGKRLEYKYNNGGDNWYECSQCPCWDFSENDYRVKPEPPKPREFWICVPEDHWHGSVCFGNAYSVKQEIGKHRTQIHVREVLP